MKRNRCTMQISPNVLVNTTQFYTEISRNITRNIRTCLYQKKKILYSHGFPEILSKDFP